MARVQNNRFVPDLMCQKSYSQLTALNRDSDNIAASRFPAHATQTPSQPVQHAQGTVPETKGEYATARHVQNLQAPPCHSSTFLEHFARSQETTKPQAAHEKRHHCEVVSHSPLKSQRSDIQHRQRTLATGIQSAAQKRNREEKYTKELLVSTSKALVTRSDHHQKCEAFSWAKCSCEMLLSLSLSGLR